MSKTPASGAGDEATLARYRLLGKRAALVFVTAVAVVFIGASAVQIVPAVFGRAIAPLGNDDRPCAEGLRQLELSLDRGDYGSPALRGDREFAENICSLSPSGLDAWAAFERLRLARDQVGLGPHLQPLRHDLEAHLPADLR